MSNNLNTTVILVALGVFLIGTWVNLNFGGFTGRVTEGTTSVSILQEASLNVTDTIINFTSGRVQTGSSSATLKSDGTADSWTGAGRVTTMEIRNDGNVKISVNMTSNVDKDGFICQGETAGVDCGVTATPAFGFYSGDTATGAEGADGGPQDGTNGEADSCTGTEGGTSSAPTSIDASATEYVVCTELQPDDNRDEMIVGAVLTIPDDAQGTKSATWTFIARAAE